VPISERELSRRVEKVVGYPSLCDMGEPPGRECEVLTAVGMGQGL
jgi:hypothetical protein